MVDKFFDKFFYIALFFIVIGILLFCLPSKSVLIICYSFVCFLICITGIIKLVFLDKSVLTNDDYYLDLIEGFISIFVSVICLNFYEYYLVSLILGIVYLIIPIVRIVLSTNKINQFIMDIFKFIFASVLFTATYHAPLLTKIYTALIFLIIGIGILVLKIIFYYKHKDDEGLF